MALTIVHTNCSLWYKHLLWSPHTVSTRAEVSSDCENYIWSGWAKWHVAQNNNFNSEITSSCTRYGRRISVESWSYGGTGLRPKHDCCGLKVIVCQIVQSPVGTYSEQQTYVHTMTCDMYTHTHGHREWCAGKLACAWTDTQTRVHVIKHSDWYDNKQ